MYNVLCLQNEHPSLEICGSSVKIYTLNAEICKRSFALSKDLRICYLFCKMVCIHQHCNRVTSIDPDDPLTHWLGPSDPDNDPDVTRFKIFKIYRACISYIRD